jgi:predicted nucleic acid-binding protein
MSALPEFVVDASVAAKWFLTDEDDVDHALRVLTDFVRGRVLLVAPDQIVPEFASTLAVASSPSRARLSEGTARRELGRFLAFNVETAPSRDLVLEAFDLSHKHACSAYDALYLILARQRTIPFINADRKLHDRIGHLPGVIWVADYATIPDQSAN